MTSTTLFLTTETSAALIALFGALLVIAVVIVLLTTSSIEEGKTEAKKKVYRLRGKYFVGLVAVLVVALIITLSFLPYPRFQKKPDAVVTVIAKQWAWVFHHGKADKAPEKVTGGAEISLPVNQLVRFNVTSADVNHDFAIYNDKGVLLKQVMAMPEYHNKLEYKFTKTGDYEVVCLEYCGLAHPYMVGTIHIN